MASVAAAPDVHFMRRLIKATPANPARVQIDMDERPRCSTPEARPGVAKAAVLTHRNLSSNVQQVAAWFVGARPGKEVMLGCLPFFHVFRPDGGDELPGSHRRGHRADAQSQGPSGR